MKFFIYKHYKYVNYPILGSKKDTDRAIKYWEYKYDKNKENYGKEEWTEYLDGLKDYIQKIKLRQEKEGYRSYVIPGYGIVSNINKHSTILDFQMVIENSHDAIKPESGDEVFLIRYLEKPQNYLKYVPF